MKCHFPHGVAWQTMVIFIVAVYQPQMKTSSSKAAISMIIEKPENEILLLKDILPGF